jgi:hypothetical protein
MSQKAIEIGRRKLNWTAQGHGQASRHNAEKRNSYEKLNPQICGALPL